MAETPRNLGEISQRPAAQEWEIDAEIQNPENTDLEDVISVTNHFLDIAEAAGHLVRNIGSKETLDAFFQKLKYLEEEWFKFGLKYKHIKQVNIKLLQNASYERNKCNVFQKRLGFIKENQENFERLKQVYLNMKYIESTGRETVEVRDKVIQTDEMKNTDINKIALEAAQETLDTIKAMVEKRENSWAFNSIRDTKMLGIIDSLKNENIMLSQLLKAKVIEQETAAKIKKFSPNFKITEVRKLIEKLDERNKIIAEDLIYNSMPKQDNYNIPEKDIFKKHKRSKSPKRNVRNDIPQRDQTVHVIRSMMDGGKSTDTENNERIMKTMSAEMQQAKRMFQRTKLRGTSRNSKVEALKCIKAKLDDSRNTLSNISSINNSKLEMQVPTKLQQQNRIHQQKGIQPNNCINSEHEVSKHITSSSTILPSTTSTRSTLAETKKKSSEASTASVYSMAKDVMSQDDTAMYRLTQLEPNIASSVPPERTIRSIKSSVASIYSTEKRQSSFVSMASATVSRTGGKQRAAALNKIRLEIEKKQASIIEKLDKFNIDS